MTKLYAESLPRRGAPGPDPGRGARDRRRRGLTLSGCPATGTCCPLAHRPSPGEDPAHRPRPVRLGARWSSSVARLDPRHLHAACSAGRWPPAPPRACAVAAASAFGEAPPASARLAACPVCYRDTDADGRLPSLAQPVTPAGHQRARRRARALPRGRRRLARDAPGRRPDPDRPLDRPRSTSSVATSSPAWSTRAATAWRCTTRIVTAMTQIQRWGREPERHGRPGGVAGRPRGR